MGTLKFHAWQIELTTRCPLRCIMCIKDTYRDWHRKDMDMADFLKIVPYLRYVRNVILEGWGESLMHPYLPEIIRLVKTKGCDVGFVTSGFGLDETYLNKILSAGIDFLGFSFSGATSETHNSIRINSDFNGLVETLKTLLRRNLKKPKIHIVYLILKKNIHEIPEIVKLGAEIGVKEIVFINITHISNKRQDEEKAFSCDSQEKGLYDKITGETLKKKKKYRIKINMPNLISSDVAVCSENPLENIYISVEGEVSPCVYLYPPIAEGFTRIFCGKEHKTNKISFGNIFYEDIETIWNKKEYVDFRKRFYGRKDKMKELFNLLLEPRRLPNIVLPEPPEPCKTCHKILGV